MVNGFQPKLVQRWTLISLLHVPSFIVIVVCICKVWLKMWSARKMKNKKPRNYFKTACLYLGIGRCNVLQNWYVDLATLGASLQQIWVHSGERSQSYIGVKIMFFVFLSICSTHGTTQWLLGPHNTLLYVLITQYNTLL